jgi:hypothetical protein
VNGTGTGEIVVEIRCPDRIPLGAGFLSQAKKPGTYTEKITVKAEPDPSCDPTQGKILLIIFENIFRMFVFHFPFIEPCEQWLPGTYNVTVELCNGECGSKHPHSAIYSSGHGSFQLTG